MKNRGDGFVRDLTDFAMLRLNVNYRTQVLNSPAFQKMGVQATELRTKLVFALGGNDVPLIAYEELENTRACVETTQAYFQGLRDGVRLGQPETALVVEDEEEREDAEPARVPASSRQNS